MMPHQIGHRIVQHILPRSGQHRKMIGMEACPHPVQTDIFPYLGEGLGQCGEGIPARKQPMAHKRDQLGGKPVQMNITGPVMPEQPKGIVQILRSDTLQLADGGFPVLQLGEDGGGHGFGGGSLGHNSGHSHITKTDNHKRFTPGK
ncbi:hypothetical protein D3C71_1735700 [compost metagenome]